MNRSEDIDLSFLCSGKLQSHVVLLGYMGSGKTTVGTRVATLLQTPFYETDEKIEDWQGLPVERLLSEYGEQHLRYLETKVLKNLLTDNNPSVISTGGGVVIKEENWKLLRQHSITFSLLASPETIYSRLLSQNRATPRAKGVNFAHIEHLMNDRQEFYRNSDYILWTDDLTPAQIANRIKCILSEIGYFQ